MLWTWIKKWMPRGLYGRAALILIVPIVTVQLVVSIAYLQRYFDDVTQQLSVGLELELNLLLGAVSAENSRAPELADALRIGLELGPIPDWTTGGPDRNLWYDLTAGNVVATLRTQIDGIAWIDLAGRRDWVEIGIAGQAEDFTILSFERERISATNPHQLFVIMIFTGILMTGVAYLFLRNQLRPIRRLARAADAFGKGNVIRYKPSGALEVRAAGNAFLDMRARIERQIEQRTLMLSGVSHDLRTPLTRLKLGLSLLEEDEELAALLRDVEEMERLLNTFLEFARSDALDEASVSNPANIASEIAANAIRSGGQVDLNLPKDTPDVILRPDAVGRALTNLVSNALRYGTAARLTLKVTSRVVRFSVEDNGPGISRGNRDTAIRPFERLDQARNQNEGGGVGLGLAIANDIARGHGGSLRLGDSGDFGGLKVDLILARVEPRSTE